MSVEPSFLRLVDHRVLIFGGLKKIRDSRDYLAVLLQQLKYVLLVWRTKKSVTVHHEFLPSQTYPGPPSTDVMLTISSQIYKESMHDIPHPTVHMYVMAKQFCLTSSCDPMCAY